MATEVATAPAPAGGNKPAPPNAGYEPPGWAGKPSVGLHLDVTKDSKLVQKLMIDEKKCYLFGRNPQMTDFTVDHGSCSRVHAALIWHKHLERSFLVDLGSTHGTYIGNCRLEANKPTQLPVDSVFRFGESTRRYVLRERPKSMHRPIMEELEKSGADADGGLLGLPETENELDNLTEFNTAQNRRISMLGITKDADNFVKKKRRTLITFNEEEDVINPEDIDPSIGKFRNMIQSSIIPKSTARHQETGFGLSSHPSHEHSRQRVVSGGHVGRHHAELYEEEDPAMFSTTLSSSLGLSLPNPAPSVDLNSSDDGTLLSPGGRGEKRGHGDIVDTDAESIPRKKKYAKEAWPGRKPGPGQGLF